MVYWLVSWLIMPFLRRRVRRVLGREHIPENEPLVIVANHNSWIDPALIISTLYPVVKRKIWFIAASKKYRALGGLPIDWANKGRVIDDATAILQEGGVIGIFPEGNANGTGELHHGRTGAARLALRTGAAVLPIGVRNTTGTNPLAAMYTACTAKSIALEIGSPLLYPKTLPEEITYARLQDVTADILNHLAILSGKHNNHGLSNPSSDSLSPDSPTL
ncbi:MAG: lysophospholipid acyltransferase family protein [Patescibacteria group bacterium]